jgi:hypothetical protein
MAKRKLPQTDAGVQEQGIIESPEQKLARLEAENAALRNTQNELEAKIAANTNIMSKDDMQYFSDLQYLKKVGRVETNTIKVKETNDHKNISLWTKEGKRIGPLHPDNARATYEKFLLKGKRLLVKQPTEEEIAEYKKTPEYIAEMQRVAEDRARKEKSRKGKGLERLLEAMAKLTGLDKSKLMQLEKQPLPLSEGRGA